MDCTGSSDYSEALARVLTFNPGETTFMANVATGGDQILENDETFTAVLRNQRPGRVQRGVDQAEGLILNDDSESSP